MLYECHLQKSPVEEAAREVELLWRHRVQSEINDLELDLDNTDDDLGDVILFNECMLYGFHLFSMFSQVPLFKAFLSFFRAWLEQMDLSAVDLHLSPENLSLARKAAQSPIELSDGDLSLV